MKYLTLPNNIQMPKLGFGTYRMDGPECETAVRDAIDTGYRHIDTAQIYENEEAVGRAINQVINTGKATREQLFITTKLHPENLGHDAILSSVYESLRKLGTKYIDLLLIHFDPQLVGSSEDLRQPLGAMHQLMKAGKVQAIGLSNFNAERMKEATKIADELGFKIACNQIEYHPFLVQSDLLKYARDNKIAITAHSPLFGGQTWVGHDNPTVRSIFSQGGLGDNPTLKAIAAKYLKTPQQVALRWLMDQEGVAAIAGTGNKEHAISNFNIFDFTLTEEEHRSIGELNKGARIFNSDSPYWGTVPSHSITPRSRTTSLGGAEETTSVIEEVATISEGHKRVGLWAAGIAAAAAVVGGGWALYEHNRKKENSPKQNPSSAR